MGPTAPANPGPLPHLGAGGGNVGPAPRGVVTLARRLPSARTMKVKLLQKAPPGIGSTRSGPQYLPFSTTATERA